MIVHILTIKQIDQIIIAFYHSCIVHGLQDAMHGTIAKQCDIRTKFLCCCELVLSLFKLKPVYLNGVMVNTTTGSLHFVVRGVDSLVVLIWLLSSYNDK